MRALDQPRLAAALRTAGHRFTHSPDGALSVDSDTEHVGRVAARAGAILTELRSRGTDLEALFLTLTSAAAADDSLEATV